jgi:methylenetetrahydrofolate--tRNA-(uracil-5-)-methyltransferase
MHRRPGVFLAGQITGVEGYVESAAVGLWLGKYLAGREHNTSISLPPQETTLGGLLRFLNTPKKHFQPMNVNFGLLPPLEQRAKKAKRKELYAQRALQACDVWLKTLGPE